ncbi:hypothetical protein BO07_3172 [Burkholderia mallei]|nr:hypothetical protein BO07_3172 [Burkholderia mallei]
MSTPFRINGSPPLPISRVSADDRPASLFVVTSLPVIIRPQVAALTNSDGAWPTCERQSPLLILSRISASRVARSGIRSSASARHISATPSWLDSENSWISPSTPPPELFSRSASTRPAAIACTSDARLAGSRASPIRNGTHSGSGRRYAAVIAARSTDCGCTLCANSRNGCGAPSSSPSAWLSDRSVTPVWPESSGGS